MLRFEHTDVYGIQHALRGMRNPYDSWQKSDSGFSAHDILIGDEDKKLCRALIRAGTEHCKFLRQIICWVDITAPRFWWTEFDTYRAGVEKNSCSTMHTIMRRPFTDEDFAGVLPGGIIADLNALRESYIASNETTEKQAIWRRLIERLPQSYMQKRTVSMSYQAIRAMCRQRKGHKLTEWHDFIAWAKDLPESWMLIDNNTEDNHGDND